MNSFSQIPEGEEVAGVVTPVAPRRSVKWGVIAAVAVGLATVGYVSIKSTSATSALDEVAPPTDVTMTGSDRKEGEIFDIRFQNEYADDGWRAYSFLRDVQLVEPMRKTTVSVRPGVGLKQGHVIASCKLTAEAILTNQVDSTPFDNISGVAKLANFRATVDLSSDVDMDGEFFAGHVYFPQPGTFSATATCELREKGQLTSERTQVETAECLYVRRELRRLTDEDRNDFFDALLLAYKITEDEAKQRFPNQHFRSMTSLIASHLAQTVYDMHLDHLHNGLGFLTHHAALTSLGEFSIQVINPRVSMPYWDYTIDSQWLKKDKARTLSDSELFTKDWFGKTNTEEHTVTEGRWAYLKVPLQKEATEADDYNFHRNAYGRLRSPWNLNESPYVTRFVSGCGMPHTDNMPSCGTHLDLVQSENNWADFGLGWVIKFGQYHDNAHLYTGGFGGDCTDVAEETVNFVGYNLTRALLASADKYAIWMWRYKLYTVPTCSPGEPCRFLCSKNVTEISKVMELYIDNGDLDDWKAKSDSDKTTTFEMLFCETKTVLGDAIDAGGVNDPTFWPIHPTVERLYQFKDLVKPMTDKSWPANGSSVCAQTWKTNCKAHHAYDKVAFLALLRNDEGNYMLSLPTNQEFLHKMTPTSGEYAMSYVYENFRWPHCEMDGFQFPKVSY